MHCGRVCALECRCPQRPKTLDFLELKLWVILSPNWSGCQEPNFIPPHPTPARAACTLNFRVISPVLRSKFSLFPVICYKWKAQIKALAIENWTRCSLTWGFLWGHDPPVGRDLQTQHTAMTSSYVQICRDPLCKQRALNLRHSDEGREVRGSTLVKLRIPGGCLK